MLLSSHTKSCFENLHDFHHLEQVTAQKASYSPIAIDVLLTSIELILYLSSSITPSRLIID